MTDHPTPTPDVMYLVPPTARARLDAALAGAGLHLVRTQVEDVDWTTYVVTDGPDHDWNMPHAHYPEGGGMFCPPNCPAATPANVMGSAAELGARAKAFRNAGPPLPPAPPMHYLHQHYDGGRA